MQELAIPIFISIWIQNFGVDPALIGTVVAVGYGLYGFGALPSGLVTDAYGSKLLMTLCLLGMGSAFLLLAIISNIVGVTLALIIWGAAASVYHPAGLRLISNGVTNRGTAYAYHGIAGNIGIAVGPLVAVLFLIVLDWQLVAALMSLPALIGAVYVTYVSVDEAAAIDETEQAAVSEDGLVTLQEFLGDTRKLFLGGFLIAFPILVLEGFFYRGMLTFLPDLLAGFKSLAPVDIGGRTIKPSRYVFIGVLVAGMFGQYVGGLLSERVAPARALVGAFLSLTVLSLLFIPAVSSGLFALVLITGLLGFVLFGEQPLLQAVIANNAGADVRGLSFGYMFFAVFGVGALGSAFSGAVLTYATQETLFLLLAVAPALAAVVSAMLVTQVGVSDVQTDHA